MAAPACLLNQILNYGDENEEDPDSIPVLQDIFNKYYQSKSGSENVTKVKSFTSFEIDDNYLNNIIKIPQNSNAWLLQRQNRITASNFGVVFLSKQPGIHLINKILGKSSFTGNVQTEYGTLNEPIARNLYVQQMEKNGNKIHL